jgi:mRNA-degrading endonuclease RelE of RelBE toxin-antitoxin system
MLQNIHFSQRFIKQIQALGKSDRKGILAAGQAEAIITSFRNYGAETEETRIKLTRHGESRLKNSRKYDLGGGYRLITLREGGQLLFACVGSHDDTDLWLERNRGTTIGAELQLGPCETIRLCDRPGDGGPCQSETVRSESDAIDHYETDLLRRIDEKTLRQIFSSFYNLIFPASTLTCHFSPLHAAWP